MSWGLYERRLLWRGETKRDRNINTIKRNIENKMPDNPAFKHVVVNGEYDIALTFFSTDYTNEKRFSTVYDGDVVNIDDVGVGEHCDRLRLVMEAAAELGVLGQILTEDLDGYESVQPVAARLIDPRHTSAAYEFKDLISIVE